jgi:HEAT repeat protein
MVSALICLSLLTSEVMKMPVFPPENAVPQASFDQSAVCLRFLLYSDDDDKEVTKLVEQLRSSDREKRLDAVIALSVIKSRRALAALETALQDSSDAIRAAAITGLGNSGEQSVAPRIATLLTKEKKAYVRKAAAYALGQLGSLETTAALAAALKDKDVEVRGAAAVALGDYSDRSAVASLIGALADDAAFVRAQAARALGVNGRDARTAVPSLIKLLRSDSDNEAKRQAADSLGRIGDPAALPTLKQIAGDSDPYLGEAARDAIKRIRTGN